MMRAALHVFALLAVVAVAVGPSRADAITAAQRVDLLAHVRPDRIQADADGDGLFDNLAATIAARAWFQPLEVIVRYKPGHEDAVALIAERVSRRLEADHSVVARLMGAEIAALVAFGDIESIEANVLCHYDRDTSQSSFGITKARSDFGFDGNADADANAYSPQDIVIAVIDSGIDGNHPDFRGGKIIAWKDFVGNKEQPYDDVGHGTHVASIAAGAVSNVGGVAVGGVAPGAALVGLKVGDAQGASSDAIAAALDWCVTNKDRFGIKVVNISLDSDLSSAGTDAVSRAVDRASAAGLVVCASASNSGPRTYTIGSPDAAQSAITVGNMYDLGPGKDGFALEVRSGRGPTADGRAKPDVCGPGVSILAANALFGNYVRLSGTSMAAPFVAGLAGLMIQANPKLAPAEVKAILVSTAVHFGPSIQFGSVGQFGSPGRNNDFGAGRVDGYAALLRASGMIGTPPAVPRHLYGEGYLPAAGASQLWQLAVTDAQFPIAVTMLLDSADDYLTLVLLDPRGVVVALAESATRQVTLRYRPSTTGTFTLGVSAINHAASYSLDVSAGTPPP
jgi:serine protease AprX